MQKITPFLWFEDNAKEAVDFYVSIFAANPQSIASEKYSKIGKVVYYDELGAKASGRPVGSVMTAEFELNGQQFVALNGGPYFKFSGAISFVINCSSQEEVDYFWEELSKGGEKGMCGWINKDKFGVTWQIVPTILANYLSDPNPKKVRNVMQAMLGMKKIIIEDLKKAYEK